MKKKVSGIMLSLLLIGMLTLAFNTQSVKSTQEPPTVEWDRTYGGTDDDYTDCVIQTSDGGYALAGTSHSPSGGYDMWLIKVDSTGNLQWERKYPGLIYGATVSMVQTSDGGYALTGPAESRAFWLVKTDSNGNMQWDKTYGGGKLWTYSVIQTSDGGYALAGSIEYPRYWDHDMHLVKADLNGNLEWTRTYGGSGFDMARSVVQTVDGGYALAGVTTPYGPAPQDMWLVKTDASGNTQWNKTYGGTGDDMAFHMIQTNDGGYALAGYSLSFGAGSHDFWLVKTDVDGNSQWNKTYGCLGWDEARHVVQTADGGYVLVGFTSNSTSYGVGTSIWLIKIDANGGMEWNQQYTKNAYNDALSVIQTRDRGYAVTGRTGPSASSGRHAWLIKLAPLEIPATIDIDPHTLNLKSKGKWITGYIEFPEGYNVADINVSSILLNGTIPVCPCAPTAIGDYDSDGIPDLMVKFCRLRVILFILCHINITELLEEESTTVTLTITGKLNDGTPFEGSDTIEIILPMPRHCRLMKFY